VPGDRLPGGFIVFQEPGLGFLGVDETTGVDPGNGADQLVTDERWGDDEGRRERDRVSVNIAAKASTVSPGGVLGARRSARVICWPGTQRSSASAFRRAAEKSETSPGKSRPFITIVTRSHDGR
jgi:hypothetical protein